MKCGFEVKFRHPQTVNKGDVLVIWNRYGVNHEYACRFEAEGGMVLVAENGYLAEGGQAPVHMNPRSVYAIGRFFHNDHKTVHQTSEKRLKNLNLDIKPWRMEGNHVLICPNRSFGTPKRIMPVDWAGSIRKKLKSVTGREIRVRPHPHNNIPAKPLIEDLEGCFAMIIWASSAGVHALLNGIPVVSYAPSWICQPASDSSLALIERGLTDAYEERNEAFERMAHAQFNLDEIESGYAFNHVLCAKL